MKSYYITTGKRSETGLIARAQALASQWGLIYIPRHKQSVENLLRDLETSGIFILERERLVYKGLDFNVFWHPSTSKIATGELEQLNKTSLIRALDLKDADHVLDCTFGLGSDALRIAMALGKSGKLTGIEAQLPLALLASEGLGQIEKTQSPALIEAAKRIELHHGHHLAALKALSDNAYDVIYFDPMFERPKLEAHGINGIRPIAEHEGLSKAAIEEALRVCRRRVVIKERFGASIFNHQGITEVIGEKDPRRAVYGIMKKDF